MIIEKVILHNFGLFRGRQAFDLSPTKVGGKARPIVLFGGVNGAGKTTILDALQLALYGPRARCSKRSSLAYDEFLLQSIHHGAEPEEGAGVSLRFRSVVNGRDSFYEVHREWQARDGRLRKDLRVSCDGQHDQWTSENWHQLVEDLVPIEVSHLFFFDAEKIRTLTEDEGSSQALGAAIKSLLGLDIVERLMADAAYLQAQLAREAGSPRLRKEVEELEGQIRDLSKELTRLRFERASLESDRQKAEAEHKEADATFRAAGGRHWEAKEAREGRRRELEGSKGELEARLVQLASGMLPLALVPGLLESVRGQESLERRASESLAVLGLLDERDARLLELLREAGAAAKVADRIRAHLESDRQSRRELTQVRPRIGLSETGRGLLEHFLGNRQAELQAEAQALLRRHAETRQRLEDLVRDKAAMPDEAEVGLLIEEFRAATERLTLLNGAMSRLEATIAGKEAEQKKRGGELSVLLAEDAEREIDREEHLRMSGLARRTRETMLTFLQRATERKIDRLSALITESFRHLLRKRTLVERILIEPSTFAITLYDKDGHELAKQRLSEGEKQIFAISVLWGLAKAATRPLPAVIDTPMARLDAKHRRHLIERYFPHASHQVIILSTDTEVDRDYYEALQPYVARAYHLDYDEGTRVTTGEEGYFWRGEARPAGAPNEIGAGS